MTGTSSRGSEVRARSALLAAALTLIVLAAACSRKMAMDSATPGAAPPAAPAAESVALRSAGAPAADGQSAAPQPAPAMARKLVKTVDLVVQVRDTKASAERLQGVAASLGGYLSTLSAERHGELLYYTLTLRVPVERLGEAVAAVEREAERIDRQSVRTDDVTERWVDLSARVKTLRATEEELQKLLAESRQRGQKLEDIMAVYDKLTEIRSSIEQIQGQLVALESLAALSTVNVQLYPTEGAKPIVDEGWQPGQTLRRSARALVRGFQALADFGIVLLVVGLPLLLVIALPVWLVVRLLRRWLRRRAEPPPPA